MCENLTVIQVYAKNLVAGWYSHHSRRVGKPLFFKKRILFIDLLESRHNWVCTWTGRGAEGEGEGGERISHRLQASHNPEIMT